MELLSYEDFISSGELKETGEKIAIRVEAYRLLEKYIKKYDKIILPEFEKLKGKKIILSNSGFVGSIRKKMIEITNKLYKEFNSYEVRTDYGVLCFNVNEYSFKSHRITYSHNGHITHKLYTRAFFKRDVGNGLTPVTTYYIEESDNLHLGFDEYKLKTIDIKSNSNIPTVKTLLKKAYTHYKLSEKIKDNLVGISGKFRWNVTNWN